MVRALARPVALPTLPQLRRGHDFRSGRLMHRGVRGIREPGLLVDEGDTPAAVAGAREMVEPGDRAIVDGKRKALFGLIAERHPDRRLDGAAMRDRDDVAAGLREIDALDGAANAGVQIHETFAVRRWLVDRREPVAADVDGPGGEEVGAVETLPVAEMLLVEVGLVRHRVGFGEAGGPDRCRGLIG